MNKPIIGIVAPRIVNNDRPYMTYSKTVDNYSKRILEAGGIPIGVFFPEGKFNDLALNLCDGILITGGPHMSSYHLNVINYAIRNKIPLLGICLGLQVMAGYEWIISKLQNPSYDEIESFYKPEYEKEFTKRVENHNNVDPFYLSEVEKSKHTVILEDSKLKNIYNKNKLYMPSVHNHAVIDIFKNFKVVGRAYDETIEAIEYKGYIWMIGVQFHPELEEENIVLFKDFIKEASKFSLYKNICS